MHRFLALVVISLLACTADPRPTGTAVVSDSAGVRIVYNTEASWQPGQELLEMRLVATEGDEQRRALREQFNATSSSPTVPALADVMIDEPGNIWVEEYDWLSVQPRRWTVFDTTGAMLGTMPERSGDLTVS